MSVDFVCEVLGDSHDASEFSSGRPTLDDWLRKSARDSDSRNLTRTYVWYRRGDGVVVAYYSMMPYIIQCATLTKRQGKGLPGSIPCYLIAKLALHEDLHHQRLGSQLLASALERACLAADSIGGRFIVVDAIDEVAESFYVHHGFEPIGDAADRLIISTKTVLGRTMS